MAQFDVYENPDQDSKSSVPFLLDVQADLLNKLNTRVVVPLVPASAFAHPIPLLNPQLDVEGATVVMLTAELAGIHIRLLGAKVGNLKHSRAEIITALDFLFTGF
ncbi:CcdB family protein [Geomonas subterranea]|uniref:CcdB family protein n=1 Tax=Geomonas subterranea TaxID=2847989 RepID=A0ABX8LCY4_9BACT|nr:CcdB family protein [Geomonas subterranea]QXE89284.1 CcdB family protein [Geomonas subterranea]QXM08603.1 CcdB family protein [Geomonas subterranea]